jgi:hypothetical protein
MVAQIVASMVGRIVYGVYVSSCHPLMRTSGKPLQTLDEGTFTIFD